MSKGTFLLSVASGATSPSVEQAGVPIRTARGLERLELPDHAALFAPVHAAGRAQQVVQKVFGLGPSQAADPGHLRQRFIEAWTRTAFSESLYAPAMLVLPDEVLIARHPLGVEAVWYGLDPAGALCVGSSLRELASAIGPTARARPLGIIDWAHHGLATPPRSPLEGIYAVNQDHVACWNRTTGESTQSPCWHVCDLLDAGLRDELAALPDRELEERLERELEEAIVCAIGDASTVGALVSGGVDSSLMAAIIHRRSTIQAVTVSLPAYPQFDEVTFARQAAAALNFELHEFAFTKEKFQEALPCFIEAQCSPAIVENSVALFACAQSNAFDGADVILDGEGADTAHFGMLGSCKWSANAFALHNSLGFMGKAMTYLAGRLASPVTRLGAATTRSQARAGLATLLGAREMDCWEARRSIDERIAGLGFPEHEREIIATIFGVLHGKSHYLWHFDVMGMMMDRQIRFPFIEEIALKAPLNTATGRHIVWDMRTNRLNAKAILKRIAVKHLPHGLIYRPKSGFSVPGAAWLPDWPSHWIADSWAAEVFGLGQPGLERFLREERSHRDYYFLTTIEIFGRLYGRQITLDDLNEDWFKACGLSGKSRDT